MSTNQLHGRRFEDMIKSCGLFLGACDRSRSALSRFDIEADFDPVDRLPTSVKTTHANSIGLGDARSMWEILSSHRFRMIVGRYHQFTSRKVFGEIIEVVIDPSMAPDLLGSITPEEVSALHFGIGLDAFTEGDHASARLFARREVARLNQRGGIITLNPKIDSFRQRRLQCSLDTRDLMKLIQASGGSVKIHDMHYGDLFLPFALRSDARVFC